jgi:hypothetical protein
VDSISCFLCFSFYTVSNLLGSLNTARNVFTNLNKSDDTKSTQKDSAVDIAKTVATIACLITNFVINLTTNLVVDTASCLTDFQEGRKKCFSKTSRYK